MRKFFSISLFIFLSCSVALAENAKPFAVVELFTSEGCSSCPPADKVLSELQTMAQKDGLNIFPLSFHISYWNYLGWDDPYSLAAADERQNNYGQWLSTSLYTPQMFVNGTRVFVGNNRALAIKNISDELERSPRCGIDIQATKDGSVKYTVTNAPVQAVLNLAVVQANASSEVSKGENVGKTLAHVNVVREFQTIDLNSDQGEAQVHKLQNDWDIIAYVQDTNNAQICAATQIDP